MFEGNVTWAEIDLDAIEHNVRTIKHFVGEHVDVFAVVKANAYGHGMVPVARAALHAGANRLAVHRTIEGVALHKAGLDAPILVMGYTPISGVRMVVQAGLTPSVITLEFAQALSTAAQDAGRTVPVHLKVDTGMNRFGLMPDEVVAFAKKIKHLPGIFLEGLFTQFGTADWADRRYSMEQLDIFKLVLADLSKAGINIPLVHAANSAAIAHFPESIFDAVRLGKSLYGLAPSTELPPPFELHATLSLKTTISRVRDLPAGSAISYNRTYITDHPIRAALVPIGYGDGYSRSLSNRSSVLIQGQRACVLGLICMDQMVVDVSHIPSAKQDDEVVIIGRQENEAISLQDLANLEGSIPNEIFTSLSSRVVRYYFRGDKPVLTEKK